MVEIKSTSYNISWWQALSCIKHYNRKVNRFIEFRITYNSLSSFHCYNYIDGSLHYLLFMNETGEISYLVSIP